MKFHQSLLLYSERRGLGVRHKPDARVYADTKSCLVPNYFVVGIALIISMGTGACNESSTQSKPPAPVVGKAEYDSLASLVNRYKVWYEILLDSIETLDGVIAEKEEVIAHQKEMLGLDEQTIGEEVSQGNYTYGVPLAPPYRKLSYTGGLAVMEDCSKGKSVTGYVIEADLEHYEVLIQDEFGVRETYYIEVEGDDFGRRNDVPRIFIPGMKVHMEMQYCGSAGYGYIMSVKTLRR
ncbi:hypothetical protein [Phaeodactylibacter xiamenensis]|uniref:hypothetical protein n=1 Tax=Phaeodactylibacter xiamenensis TaxID=1524460 RepID=UPI003CCBE2F9